MKLKKLIAGAASTGLVLTMAGTALAYDHYHGGQNSLTINNSADVSADVHQTATSGDNTINGNGDSMITTGESSNSLRLKQDVNYNEIGGSSSDSLSYDSYHSHGKKVSINNAADVSADVHQTATSGDNQINQNEDSYSLEGLWRHHHHGGTAQINTGLSHNDAGIDQFVNTVIMPD